MQRSTVAGIPGSNLLSVLALGSLLVVLPRVALAQTSDANRAAASEAYTNGQTRYLEHDFAGAANWFETADRLAPNSIALQNAIHAHRGAGGTEHLARAATLAIQLQARYPDDAHGTQLAQTTVTQLAPQLGRVTVHCDHCEIEIDSRVQSGTDVFVPPGHHAVLAHFQDGGAGRDAIDVVAGATRAVTLTETEAAPAGPSDGVDHSHDNAHGEPPPSPPVDNPGARVITPAVFVIGLVATAGLGVGAALSWVDAVGQGNGLITYAMQHHEANPAMEASTNGAEIRTTVLDISTGVVGAATLVIGAFFTRWSGPPRREHAQLAPMLAPGMAGMGIGGTF